MDSTTDVASRISKTSRPYIGQWNRLVSTTNWEKGRIIHEWREVLSAAEAAASECSDEAWSRAVGGVTGQHVGRLRRVYERFGEIHKQYEGLYWSHFQAALDWDDAEMWLEGAIQKQWSVSQMRRQRWETLGASPEYEPVTGDIVSSDLDEDVDPSVEQPHLAETAIRDVESVRHDKSTAALEPDDDHENDSRDTSRRAKNGNEEGASIYAEPAEQGTVPFVRPFEHLPELPDDLSDAFERYKLAILRHKAEGWHDVSLEDVLASLDALKELARVRSFDNSSP